MTRSFTPRYRCAPARTLTCALVVAVATAVTVLVSGSSNADPAPAGTDCPQWTAVLVPGTWEHQPATPDQPTGTLAAIGQGLRQRYGSNISLRTLAYTASAMPSMDSESSSVQQLSTLLRALCSSTRVVLAGYSQGADIAGNLATAIGHNRGPLPASQVGAVALISDPHRNPDTPQLGKLSPGEGIAGPRADDFGALAGKLRTLCATGDIYCATTPQAAPALAALGRTFTGDDTPPGNGTAAPRPLQIPSPTTAPVTGSQAILESAQTALGSIEGLDPSEIVGQVVTVLSGLAGFAADVPAIVNDLAQLPGLIASGNLPGLHQLSQDLNNQFAPLVQLAAGIDLHLIGRALTLAAPLDTSGWTAVTAQIVNILAGLDIARLATDIGQAQEIAWGAVQKLTTGDPAGAALALSGLIPIAADLTTAAAAALSGDAGTHLARLANAFTTATTPDTRSALTDLARDRNDAARTATSGVRPDNYTTTLQQALDWLSRRIESAR